jgi:multisubunit Na+/H+ antiporter MnhB subunit
MTWRELAFSACIAVLLVSVLFVMQSPLFNSWESRDVGRYYIERGPEETESPNVVSSIVWDFRGFDTLGEETVLFTAAVGVFTVILFGVGKKRKVK